jgi:hypothetical protein
MSAPMVDVGMERALAAWILAEPSHLVAAYDHGLTIADLGDYHARAAVGAAANVAAGGEAVTPDAVRAQLQHDHDRRGWIGLSGTH